MNTRYKENVQKLFEYWCEISPAAAGDKAAGHIVESFPENFRDPEIITKIPEFAYPCKFANESVQTYSFVLTSDDSKWRFGFCRHDTKVQNAMIIITYLPWHDTFIKFLNVLGELKRANNGEFQPFLSEAYIKGVPEPGASLKLFYNNAMSHFVFKRPSQFQLPSIPENHNLNLYYNFVDPKNMIAVFAAMLAERRMIFTSRRLDRLSACVQAANAFLYPMVWQHIFIPILPMKMKEFLCAPMPYLIGVPEAVLQTMTRDELGEVVILNCDNKILESPFDDVKNMPHELVSQLKKHLNNPHEHIGDRVSKIFLGVLVQLIGGYRDAIKFMQGEKITWDRDTFIESRPSHLRPFLRNVLELQIFQQFIEERLEMLNTGLGFSDEFELETLRHLEKSGRRGKHYKTLLRNVKDKVKQGSRGVKTAYKDLKSKLRDKTPPQTVGSSTFNRDYNNGGATSLAMATGSSYHHSAPNSPVFNKRPLSEFTSSSPLHISKQNSRTMLQTSNSLMNNSNYANNNHIDESSSPAISPTSSISSSEMNILQELQQHALFKLPTVDRSLKPTASIDYPPVRPQRSGSLINAPNERTIREVPTGTLCLLDDAEEANEQSFESACSSMSFDSPPEASPPVPPRTNNPPPSQFGTSATSSSASSVSLGRGTQSIITPPPRPLPPSKKSSIDHSAINTMTFENNFVNNDAFSIANNRARAAPLPIPPAATMSTVVADTTASFPNRLCAEEEPDSSNLIQLDSSTSFELDDFDPLNQNAKDIPPPTLPPHPVHFLPHPSSSSRPQAFSNPVYPFFTPQRQPSTLHGNGSVAATNTKTSRTDDDVELLRQYGLDKFNLNDNSHLKLTNGKTGNSQFYTNNGTPNVNGSVINKHHSVDGVNSGRGGNSWATFE